MADSDANPRGPSYDEPKIYIRQHFAYSYSGDACTAGIYTFVYCVG